jgi:hypothetical protein
MSYYPTAGKSNPASVMQHYKAEMERIRQRRIEDEDRAYKKERQGKDDEFQDKSRSRQEEVWGNQDVDREKQLRREKGNDAWTEITRRKTEQDWETSDEFVKTKKELNEIALGKAKRAEDFHLSRDAYQAARMGNIEMLKKLGVTMTESPDDEDLFSLNIPGIGDIDFSKSFSPEGDEAVFSGAFAKARRENPDITKHEFLKIMSDNVDAIRGKGKSSSSSTGERLKEVKELSNAIEQLDKEFERMDVPSQQAEIADKLSKAKGIFGNDRKAIDEIDIKKQELMTNIGNIQAQKKILQDLRMLLLGVKPDKDDKPKVEPKAEDKKTSRFDGYKQLPLSPKSSQYTGPGSMMLGGQ